MSRWLQRLLLLSFPRHARDRRGAEAVGTLLDAADAGKSPGLRDVADVAGLGLRSRFGLADRAPLTRLTACAAPGGLALAASVSTLAFLLGELRRGPSPSWDPYLFGPFATTGVLLYAVIALVMAATLAAAPAAARGLAVLAVVTVPGLLVAYHRGGTARPDRATLFVLGASLLPLALTPSRLISASRRMRSGLLLVCCGVVAAGVTVHARSAPGIFGAHGALGSMAYYQGPDGLVGAWAPALPAVALAVLLGAAMGAWAHERWEVWGAGCLFLLPCGIVAWSSATRDQNGPSGRLLFAEVAAIGVLCSLASAGAWLLGGRRRAGETSGGTT